MTYETVAMAAQQGGAVYFTILFAGAVIYALWPSRRATFRRAARAPLEEGQPDGD